MNEHDPTSRTQFTAALAALLGTASMPAAIGAASVTESDAAFGIRAALERGAVSAIGLLGRADGFLGNPQVRIPLPGYLNDVAKLLKATGQRRQVDELVTAMNRAAEAAVPQARQLLVSAAKAVTLDDALRIVRGAGTSVTDYFAAKTRAPLAERFLPIVTQATERVSLAERYNALAGRAHSLGLLKETASLQQYVTGKALDGLYLMIGEEEKKIRADPLGTGSAILMRVFGR